MVEGSCCEHVASSRLELRTRTVNGKIFVNPQAPLTSGDLSGFHLIDAEILRSSILSEPSVSAALANQVRLGQLNIYG